MYLLRDKYEYIKDDHGIKKFLKWINEPQIEEDDIERLKEWFEETGKEFTAEVPKQYDARYRAQKLYLIKDIVIFKELYDENKKIADAEDTELAPLPKISKTRFVAGDEGTPLTKEDMLKMSVEEALKHVSNPENYPDNKHDHIPNRPEDALAYVFQQVVKEKITEYLAADIDDVIAIPPAFLAKYFHGIWDAINADKQIDWQALITIGRRSTETYRELDEGRRVLNPLLNILNGQLRKQEPTYSESQLMEVFGICESLVDYDEHRDREHDNKDPMQIRCNSVPGIAFEGCLNVAIEHKKYKELRDRLRAVFTRVLNEIRTPETLCIFGSNLNNIYWLDEDWLTENINNIMSDKNWSVTWSTYMKWGRPSKKSFKLLATNGFYLKAIDELANEKASWSEDMVNHIVIAFFNSWLIDDRTILDEFLEKAPDNLRAHAAYFFTTGFENIKKLRDGETKEQDRKCTIERIQKYWQDRLAVIEKNPKDYEEETKSLVSWVEESPFLPKDTLELLKKTLICGNGQIKSTWDIDEITDKICSISEDHEKIALECIMLLLCNAHGEAYISDCKEGIGRLLDKVEKTISDPDTIREAMAVANQLGRLRIYDFKDNYFELEKKL